MSAQRIVEDLDNLHMHYKAGNLRLLVGAGPSMEAGFPSWGALEQSLLQAFVRKDLEDSNAKVSQLLLTSLPEITKSVHQMLGSGAMDLIWQKEKDPHPEPFYKMLGRELYGGRNIDALGIPGLHRQIAAMNNAVIFTTNYDPLIELAMARVRDGIKPRFDNDGKGWRRYEGSLGQALRGFAHDKVYHLHGFVEPNGLHRGDFVLTEGQYFELAGNPDLPPNRVLDMALKTQGALLILGMSMTDRNLKRLLYASRNNAVQNTTTYAVLKESRQLISVYQDMLWNDRSVKLLFVDTYANIESVLRQVRFGAYKISKIPEWLPASLDFLSDHGFPNKVYNPTWQGRAEKVLRNLREQIELRFPQSYKEELGVNFLIPMKLGGKGPDSGVKLRLVARIQDLTCEDSKERAMTHCFNLGYGEEEGSSGAAFVAGQINSCIDDDPAAHRNIEPQKKLKWTRSRGFKDWRSILSIPIVDSEDWVPVAVVSITSNYGIPFWNRFGEENEKYEQELKRIVRGAAHEYLLKKDQPGSIGGSRSAVKRRGEK